MLIMFYRTLYNLYNINCIIMHHFMYFVFCKVVLVFNSCCCSNSDSKDRELSLMLAKNGKIATNCRKSGP